MRHGRDWLRHDEVATLLARCAQGDRAAFKHLYDTEADRLFALALRITRNRALAADVLHDTMLQVWNNAARFDPTRGSGRVWLTALLRYRAIDAVTHAGRDTLMAEPPDIEDPTPDPFEQLSAAREARALARCLENVEGRRRQLLMAAYLDGLTHAELAARTGKPLGTVKSTIRRALRALRNCMDDPPL